MNGQTILFLHGFASSARTTKSQYFLEHLAGRPQVAYHAIDFNPTPTDFEYMTATGLINRLRQYVLDNALQSFSLIGSSFGGLVATHYAHRYGGVRRMLLLAPALRWRSWASPSSMFSLVPLPRSTLARSATCASGSVLSQELQFGLRAGSGSVTCSAPTSIGSPSRTRRAF